MAKLTAQTILTSMLAVRKAALEEVIITTLSPAFFILLDKVDSGEKFMTATYKGETDFYICSHEWEIKYSFDICSQQARFAFCVKQ